LAREDTSHGVWETKQHTSPHIWRKYAAEHLQLGVLAPCFKSLSISFFKEFIDSEKISSSFLMARDSYGKWNILHPIPVALLSIKHLIVEMISTHSQN
jgi:hypothetical protein